MRSKKKDSSEKSSFDLQTDHELFLQAFEKPTQIYRYLKTRNLISPIFLQRTLCYMKARMSRNHKNRQKFKVDCLLGKLQRKAENVSKLPGTCLSIDFKSFSDKKLECTAGDVAKIETFILKILHKKRKESSSSLTQVSVGSHEVLLNPLDEKTDLIAPLAEEIKSQSKDNDCSLPKHPPNSTANTKNASTSLFKTCSSSSNSKGSCTHGSKDCGHVTAQNHLGGSKDPCTQFSKDSLSSKLIIPSHHFTDCGHQVKSYVIFFKVTLVHDQENVGGEPHPKRRRLCRGSSQDSGLLGTPQNDNSTKPRSGGGLQTPKGRSKSCDFLAGEDTCSHGVVFGCELVLFDRHGRCQLTPGSYELLAFPLPSFNGVQPIFGGSSVVTNGDSSSTHLNGARLGLSDGFNGPGKSSPRKNLVWESFEGASAKQIDSEQLFGDSALLKFELWWAEGDRPAPPPATPTKSTGKHRLMQPAQPLDMALANSNASKPKAEGVASPEAPQLVLYQFVYNNNTRQQTEARYDFHCPWCSLKCCLLYSLLKHLKLCHARFLFTYVPHPKGARIDVSINELYDGSYAGNPMDLVMAPSGASFSRGGPARRAPTTTVLVCLPKRAKPSLSEFLEQDDAEFDLPRAYILGHNRLYHHTMSCLPIQPHELDIDSEGEHDSEWVRTKTRRLIDDFTDVNAGEKELMKIWNLHIMKFNFVGDCQLPLACYLFIEAHGLEILVKNLYRNFLLHLSSLNEFGLIGPGVLYKCILMIQARFHESIRCGWVTDYRAQINEHRRRSTAVASSSPLKKGPISALHSQFTPVKNSKGIAVMN